MGNYNFQDIGISTVTPVNNKNYDSPNFVSFGYLEDNIEGNTNNSKFKVLSVTGRELMAKTLITHDFETVHGQYYLGFKYEPRILEFTYLIDAKNTLEFNKIYNKLNSLLGQPELEFKFGDENMYFTGSLSEVDSIDTGSLKQLKTFSITCSDPFKYSTPKTASGINTFRVSSIKEPLKNSIVSKITLNVNSITGGLKDLKISYSGVNYAIKLKNLNVGDVVVVDLVNKTIKLNGAYNYNILRLNSDFENIVTDDLSIISSEGCNIKIDYTLRSI